MAKRKATQFEVDSMWMSIRYCVGRHTIASHAHAQNVATIMYDKLDNEQRVFQAMDINREITTQLRFEGFYINIPNYDELYRNGILSSAYSLLMNFCAENNLKLTDLAKFDRIDVTMVDGKIKYETKEHVDENPHFHFSAFDIRDLSIWDALAGLFNSNHHTTVTVTYDGKTETIDCFTVYNNIYDNIVAELAPVGRRQLEHVFLNKELIKN